MPDMPQTVAKGSILKRLDGVLSNQTSRAPILAQLQAGSPLLTIMSTANIVVTNDERTHVATDWFGSAWWPDAQAGVGAIEQLLRAGFIDAINKANELGVPIDTYWICHPGHGHSADHALQTPEEEQHVEVTVLWSAQQVTVIIHTPEPKAPSIPNAPRTIAEPIRVWFWANNQVEHDDPMHRP